MEDFNSVRGGVFEGMMLWKIAHIGGNKAALASLEPSRDDSLLDCSCFSLTFSPQACYPSLVVERDTPQGTVIVQTGHLSSQIIHRLPGCLFSLAKSLKGCSGNCSVSQSTRHPGRQINHPVSQSG